ncbi:MAG: PIG-L deacetylase family protein [Acidimicrobiales bacterium]
MTVPIARIVAIAPHPDDETLGCGGALALHVARGDDVSVVWLTSGERGIPGVDPASVAKTRREEARAAIAALGVTDGTFLGLADGTLSDHRDAAVSRLLTQLADRHPTVVYTPHGQEAHRDHSATTAITVEALRRHADPNVVLFGYEVWSPHAWPDHSEDVGEVFDQKLAALACHRSQTAQVPYRQLAIGLACFRGAMTLGCERAESFVAITWKEDP